MLIALISQEGIRCGSSFRRRVKSGAAPATVGGKSFSRMPLGFAVQSLGRRRRIKTREPGDLPEQKSSFRRDDIGNYIEQEVPVAGDMHPPVRDHLKIYIFVFRRGVEEFDYSLSDFAQIHRAKCHRPSLDICWRSKRHSIIGKRCKRPVARAAVVVGLHCR